MYINIPPEVLRGDSDYFVITKQSLRDTAQKLHQYLETFEEDADDLVPLWARFAQLDFLTRKHVDDAEIVIALNEHEQETLTGFDLDDYYVAREDDLEAIADYAAQEEARYGATA